MSANLALSMVIFAQTGMGVLGNALLLCNFICSLFWRPESKPVEQIVSHLVLTNILILLCGGITPAVGAFRLKYFLDDIGCKLVFYFHRVAWGNSLSTTCLLGSFQALSIKPQNSKWSHFIFKSPKCVVNVLCALSWVFHLMVNIIVLLRITGQKPGKNSSLHSDLGYCSRLFLGVIVESTFSTVFISIDVICLGVMIWASESMISFLHRHKKQVQYLQSTRILPRVSPETRAIKCILMLVSTFVIFYSLSLAFETYKNLFGNPQLWLVNTSVLLTSCFPTLSSFLLLKSMSSLYFPCRGRGRASHL